MLKKMVYCQGINNIINLSVVPSMLVNQLETESVPYRR
jgi:hypothetical protein